MKYLEWQAKCKTRSSCNLLVEKKVQPIVKSTTEEKDNSDSTTESMLDDQTNNIEVTTVIADEVQPQHTIEDTTKGTTRVVYTDIIDNTPKIIIEDDATDNVDRTTKVEDVQTDNVKITTKMIEKSPTKTKEGIDKGTQTNSVMESTSENLYQSTASPKRPHHRSHNRQIGTEVPKRDSDIKNKNEQRDDNNSPGNNSSENIFSTLVDQQQQSSSETIRDLNAETTPDIGNTPDDEPSFFGEEDDEKFSKISHSFKAFLIDFVNIISSELMGKLSSQKGSTIQLKYDKEYLPPGDDYDYGSIRKRMDYGSETETGSPEDDQKTTSSSKEDYPD